MNKPLTGHALATAYAKAHPLNEANPGKVWATYDDGGWIVLQGEGLLACPAMRPQYPNGWSLFHRIRSSIARRELASQFRKLRATYAAAVAPNPTPASRGTATRRSAP